jgi:Fe-S-cluster-containing hydrogenase component 2
VHCLKQCTLYHFIVFNRDQWYHWYVKSLGIQASFPNLCTGCRSCEVICSFHHTGGFNPFKSSIQVRAINVNEGYDIIVLPTCDACFSEEIPLCVEYCERGVLNTDMEYHDEKPE